MADRQRRQGDGAASPCRVCSVSNLAGSGFFDGPFRFAVDGKIEHSRVAWPCPRAAARGRRDTFATVTCAEQFARGQLGRLYS